ncbi:MAG: riboflavin synthase [Candidatus Gastranaerophilales bacterium]|nr:riboflavin synthase [Candidatus Gastranaerophilales bacterium]
MFTGIVEETGTITAISSNQITIKCNKVLEDTKIGDSIAVNGVCLTVTNITDNSFSADVSHETLKVTVLSELKTGNQVNLERALSLKDRLGGHIVSGHIDTIGKLLSITKQNEFYDIKIGFDKKYKKYTVNKGSITVNGISLTITSTGDNFVTITVIPHTFDYTALKHLKANDNVNLEFDILAKYVEKNLLSADNSNITMSFLERNGFV